MKGKVKIAVKNRNVSFNFTLERNITILTGDSGTGKTKLINMIRDYSQFGKASGVTLKCEKPCLVLAGNNWELELKQTQESIVFVEESSSLLNLYEFAKAIQDSDNYYVLVTRESLSQIPYSIDSIYQINREKNPKKPSFEKIYKGVSKRDISDFPYDVVIVEDSQSGFQFFKKATENHPLECVTSGGKSRIIRFLNQYKNKRVLIIADAAALGSEIRDIVYYRAIAVNTIDFFFPESFEWLILRSAIFKNISSIQEILSNPIDHIDCQEYFSWERFFTSLLVSSTKNRPNLEYKANKSQLPKGYLSEANMQSILKAMSNK